MLSTQGNLDKTIKISLGSNLYRNELITTALKSIIQQSNQLPTEKGCENLISINQKARRPSTEDHTRRGTRFECCCLFILAARSPIVFARHSSAPGLAGIADITRS